MRERHIENVRDLLIVAMGSDLERYMLDHIQPDAPQVGQRIVAFVLDHITARSFTLLAEWRAKIEGDGPAP